MSLKGYQWLNDNKQVIMTFYFKDLVLDIWQDITQKDLDDFKEFLKEQGWEAREIKLNDHQIKE